VVDLFVDGERYTQSMKIPATARNLDTITWTDEPTSSGINAATHLLRYYLRGATAGAGETLTGSASGNGWSFTWAVNESITVTTSYAWQAVAEALSGGALTTLGSGTIQLLPSLAYSGSPTAFDSRTQAQKDLDAVQAAIRTRISGGAVAEYTIGNRRLKRMEMTDLLMLESRLKAEVARERAAEMIANGMGNPRSLFVRFGRS
jgi:hypothetical protein